MKYVCIRPIELRKKNFEIIENPKSIDVITILPDTYPISVIDTDNVVLKRIRIDLCKPKFHIKVNRALLLNDGYFEGSLFDNIFHKTLLEKLNKKFTINSLNTDEDKILEIKEVQDTIKNNVEFTETLPVWMKCNIILNGLTSHFYSENDKLDEKQIEEINRIIKHQCEKNKYDYNIFYDIHSVKDIKDLADAATLAAMDVQPQYKGICKCCGEPYYLFNSEIQWYLDKGLEVPKRCEYCRKGIKRSELYYPGPEISDESLEEEPVKTEMQIALEKAGMHVTEEN